MSAPLSESEVLHVHLNLGFGISGENEAVITPEGAQLIRYRALPPALWHQDRPRTLGLINAAAEKFAPGEKIAFKDLPEETGAAESLTEKGREYFEGLPLYGELEAHEPWLRWKQFDPAGQQNYTVEANLYDRLMEDMVHAFPINSWASWFLEGFEFMLPTSAEGKPAPLFMRQPTDEERALPVVRTHEVERVEAPWGPWKVAVYACRDDAIEEAKRVPSNDMMELVETSLAILPVEGNEFEWRRHWVWKFEVPLVLVPRMLYWVEANSAGHPALWAARGIHPVHRYSQSQATYERDPARAGFRLTCHVWQTMDQLAPADRIAIEQDMREILAKAEQ